MEGFQRIVVITAGIILFLALLLMSISLLQDSTETWPPVVAQCPDWWVIDGSGNNSTCINVKDLGNTSCKNDHASSTNHQSVNFNLSAYKGTRGNCAKYKWAKDTCGVSWDGITYGVKNPCIVT